MSIAAQLLIMVVVIGLVIGGIAAFSAGGKGLVTYLVAGVVGSFVGGLLLSVIVVRDPFITYMIGGSLGAIGSVVLARSIFKLR